ncbi:aldo/keto reductase [Lentinus tigrinus ALCF2SS1-6]|uniref:Aldo/keto reductase n=1 Tax=Lentinus tigrinus ALCF2SS1-6 TaxID=1328759 RepID=A0A5C2SE39_9APHY|nr:aldo/keto reductase [Lentinus tigrinus ALCF2SS1-6]
MVKTTELGGTASNIVVAKVAHGLMTMTMYGNVSDEQAFESIKGGIDALPPGAKMMLNSSEFYGENWSLGNLELLARFFEKYPDYAGKTFLSVKGGLGGFGGPDRFRDAVRNAVDKCNAALRGTKAIDLFQPARLDPAVSVEDIVRALVELLHEGKFEHIGLSECSAQSLRRGHASHGEETRKVLAAAAELDVAVAAYSYVLIFFSLADLIRLLSPLGHGMTTGTIQTPKDLAASGFQELDRFKENWAYNKCLVDALVAMAKRKGCTPAQFSIAWVGALGDKVIPLPGSSRKERTLENLHGSDVELSEVDLSEIAGIMATNPVRGHRYYGADVDMKLWG